MRFFRRKKKIEIPSNDPPAGMYQGVWEKKRQPSPGAQAYAWESLGLSEFTPIGAGVHTRIGIRPLPGANQPAIGLAVALNGVPTTAGQLFGQPLYDPALGYTRSSDPAVNVPFPFSSEPIGGRAI